MSIEMTSSARSVTGNRGRYVNRIFSRVKERLNREKLLQIWMKIILGACVVALAIDPLFLFIPEIDSGMKCISFNLYLGLSVAGIRTVIDTFYVFHIIFYFVTEVIAPLDRSKKSLRGELSVHAVRKRLIPIYLIIDIVSVLPIPQVVVFTIMQRAYTVVSRSTLINFTKWIIVGQYIPRIIRIYPLYKQVTRTTGTIAESNWIGAALNLLVFMLFSYVFGALWYVTAIEKQSKCWHNVCKSKEADGCNTYDLFCERIYGLQIDYLVDSCRFIDPENNTDSKLFDFGMHIDVLKSGVLERKPRDFARKFVYCFWWGLRNLSTFGQSLKPGNSATDMLFAVIICASGLFLFAVLIGNVQKYMMSTTVRVEEMKEKKRDTEKWMSSRGLPDKLQKRIRKYDNYKWRKFRGTEEEALLRSLPKDLRLETKRHLYLDPLKGVPLLAIMDDRLLEALCDRANSVFY